jgi:hypothetical protein
MSRGARQARRMHVTVKREDLIAVRTHTGWLGSSGRVREYRPMTRVSVKIWEPDGHERSIELSHGVGLRDRPDFSS